MTNLSTYIKSRRQNIGLTQKELAEKLNVTVVTVSRWETGTRKPDVDSFVLLCVVLGLNIIDFVPMIVPGDIYEKIVPKIDFTNTKRYDFIGKEAAE